MSQPIKQIVIVYALGLFAGRAFEISPQTARLFLLALLLLSLCTLFINRKHLPLFITLIFFPTGLLLSGGYSDLGASPGNVANFADGSKRVVQGTVLRSEKRAGGKRLTVRSEYIADKNVPYRTKGNILLTVAGGDLNITPGDRIRFMAKLRKPRNFGNPGGFDYETYLRDRGIYATAYLKDDAYIALMGGGNPLRAGLSSFRENAEKAISQSGNERAKGIIRAITVGDKSSIDEETLRAFRRSGVAHFLAISGLHMGIVAFFFYRGFRWLLSRSERLLLYNLAGKCAAMLTIVPLTLYLIASGMATSAVRAYVMVLIFLLAVILDREQDIFNTIAVAALIILAAWPQALFDVAFQLSFSAVIVIVWLVPKMEALIPAKEGKTGKRRLRKLLAFAFVSLAAAIGTAPIISFHFMEVSLIGIVSNMIIVPLLGFLAIPAASIALFISTPLPDGAAALFSLASILAEISIRVADGIAAIPYASTLTSPPELYEIALYYLCLFSIFSLKRRWAIPAVALIPVFFLTSASINLLGKTPDKELEVTFLSVGQGESTFIRFPEGKTMLIDGGGFYNSSFDVGSMVVRPFLLSQGIKEINYLVLTHPHPDHMNGLIHIAKEFQVGEVWMTDEEVLDENHQALNDIINKRQIRSITLSDNSLGIEVDGVNIEFLNPPSSLNREDRSNSGVNNRSLVIMLSYGKRRFLLTGDLEREGEERLLKKEQPLKADVIKVPHHGSLTSSSVDFVEKVSPTFAVFTLGYMNRFGFPKEVVVDRYRKIGAKILRTDLQGAITFKTDGERLEVESFRQGP